MSLFVYTARLPHHGCDGYTGADRLDVTRGSGSVLGLHFAPSRDLLNEAQRLKKAAKKNDEQLVAAWEWYRPRYLEELRQSYRTNYGAWLELLARDELTLCCYCGTAERCHRRLLAEVLVKLGAKYLGERTAAAVTDAPSREVGEEG